MALSLTNPTSYAYYIVDSTGVASSHPTTLAIWVKMDAIDRQGQLFCLLDSTLDEDLGLWSA